MADGAIQSFLKQDPVNDVRLYSLYFRKLKYANADIGVPFTDAYIEMQKLNVHGTHVVHFSTLLAPGFECLQNYKDGRFQQMPDARKKAVKCLVDFLNSKGHPEVWHGFVDIWLNNQMTVKVAVRTDEDSDSDDDHVCETAVTLPEQSEESDWDAPGCSSEKKIKLSPHPTDPFCLSAIQVKKPKQDITSNKCVSQTVAQTIVNAFLHKESSHLVPCLCSSFESFQVYLYDPVNDFLLMTIEPLLMFDKEKKEFFSDINIIYLWMILNYDICFKKMKQESVQMLESHDLKAGFKNFAMDKFNIYQKKLIFGQKSFPSGRVKSRPIIEIPMRF
ncbi:hypothetical protein FSP39_017080 [Pinctada imbricata]|uniref:Uncharacterized protein n=1 Tax=Pinctada imbricata TaxID=66713 RepID=A0AA88YDQ9_PINIB|nr:hypothetical protein FSP39_017080 [Pinctada imbricata]